jgi:NAD(P)-dependent dehydrogenase (short-subunit alcohol dehydrogenase family)
MRVFVTGATGFIGSAIVQELINAGHQVLGLVRSDAAADALARLGVEAHRGALSDTESLAAGARACEGVIHLAFIHDFSAYAASVETDRRAVEALAGALEGSGKPLVIASGTLMVAHARPATEQDALVMTSQGDGELIIVQFPGLSCQKALVVPLTSEAGGATIGNTQLDDTVFTNQSAGELLVADKGLNTVYAITAPYFAASAYSAVSVSPRRLRLIL